MKDIHYAFCVAKIRALENRMLTKKDISALINHKDFTSAFDFLAQKGYAKENETIDDAVKRQGEELNALLEETVPDKNELKSLYILNDYFNIKVIVKCAVEGTDPAGFMIFPSTVQITDKKSRIGNFEYMNDNYRDVAKKAFNIALKSENGKFSDVIVDKAAIDALALQAKKKNSGLIGKISAFLADTSNIKTALRCTLTSQDEDFIREAIGDCCRLDKTKLISASVGGHDTLLDYLETTDYKKGVEIFCTRPSAFEKWCDDNIINMCSEANYTSFGFAPVVSYFYRKNLEIKTVRMIMTALRSDIDRDVIKERVRQLYA